MSQERIKLIKAFGAEIVLIPSKLGNKGLVDKAKKIGKSTKIVLFLPNLKIHAIQKYIIKQLGKIYKSTNKKVDIFIGGIGTGGTISGIGRYLKQMNKNIKIIGS